MKTMKDATLEALDAEVSRTVEDGGSITMLLAEIEYDTGVRSEWVQKFRGRKIPNPGVNFVQALYDWLTARARKAASRGRAKRAA